MTGLRYVKNIVTDTREYSPEELAKIEEMRKNNPVESSVEGMRLLWMDDNKVEGATFYMECLWLWEGVTTSGTTEEPHHHDFDEVIGFISTDPNNPGELDARMEIILGDETHFLTKSCLVHVLAGMKHCPLTFREVNRPVFFFTLAPISQYGRTSEMTKPQAGQSKEPFFAPPLAKTTQVVSLDDEASSGAFYVDFVWIWSGDMTMSPEPHVHDFDEMIGIIGYSGKENPREVGGNVTIALEDEKHTINQSSLIFVPKGQNHCPIEFNNVRKPVLCFTIGNTPKWGKQ